MDRYTAAAMGQNIASIGDAFMQMNDPRNRAQAGLLRAQLAGQTAENEGRGITNSFLPRTLQSSIDQNLAAAQANLAQGRNYDATAANTGVRTQASERMLRAADAFTPPPLPVAEPGEPGIILPPKPGGASVPFTTYSQGAAVGGKDEMQDDWTNKGYSSTGKNLSPGVVAVNPSVYPLGSVLKDPQTGEVFVAADRHGNKNPNVVDIFQPGDSYMAASGQRNFEVVGREDPKSLTSPEAIQATRAKYGQTAAAQFSPEQLAIFANVAAGGGANDMMLGQGRAAALGAQTEMDARQAGLAITGNAFGQGENFDPARSDAFQQRGIAGTFATQQMQEQNANLRKSAEIIAGGERGAAGSSAAGGGGIGRNPLDAVNGAEYLDKLAAERLGMGGVIDPAFSTAASAWKASVATLTEQGVPIQTAISIADEHHKIGSIKRVGDGGMLSFDGDPRMQDDGGFNPQIITPEAAQRFGIGYSFAPPGQGAGGERLFAAGMLNPEIARMAEAQVAATTQAPPPPAVGVPPMLQRPADPVPQTGPAKASDEFKPRESSGERKAREQRVTNIKVLEDEIANLTTALRSGNSKGLPSGGFGMSGPLAGGSPMTNDTYNAQLARLKTAQGELSALQAPTAAAPASLEDRLSKYR